MAGIFWAGKRMEQKEAGMDICLSFGVIFVRLLS